MAPGWNLQLWFHQTGLILGQFLTTYCYMHALVLLSTLITEVSFCCRCRLTQRLATDWGTENKRLWECWALHGASILHYVSLNFWDYTERESHMGRDWGSRLFIEKLFSGAACQLHNKFTAGETVFTRHENGKARIGSSLWVR